MAAVIGGLTILQLAQIATAVAGTGVSTTVLIDWIEKHKGDQHITAPMTGPTELDARRVLTQVVGNASTAEGFIQGVLGK
jgi:hypothetical protein